ncbi:MAG TPA: EpsG family protein [Epsilonproteobacteria bacterium]|nr:EpsG family protein [Campylobacterota bacterium]
MLIYNILVLLVVMLLSLDYWIERHHVTLRYGSREITPTNIFLYLALAAMILFAGLRFEIGYDYPKYLAGYLYDSQLLKWEPAFVFAVRLIRHLDFGLGIQAMFLFFSALTVTILYKALRSLTPYYRIGLLLYLLVPSLYLNSFSVIRQGIALTILFYGLHYIAIDKPDNRKYALTALFAFLFHYSSIFVSLLYLLGGKLFQQTYSWITYLFLQIVSLFLSFAHIGKLILSHMPGHFGAYVNYTGAVSPLKLLIVNLFFLFFMIQKEYFVKNRLDHYLLNTLLVGLIIFNIFSDFVYVTRLAQFFLVAQIVLVPIYLHSIKNVATYRMMLVLFALYYLFNFNYALYRDEHFPGNRQHFLIPYKNYLFEEQKSPRVINIDSWINYLQEEEEEKREETLR